MTARLPVIIRPTLPVRRLTRTRWVRFPATATAFSIWRATFRNGAGTGTTRTTPTHNLGRRATREVRPPGVWVFGAAAPGPTPRILRGARFVAAAIRFSPLTLAFVV